MGDRERALKEEEVVSPDFEKMAKTIIGLGADAEYLAAALRQLHDDTLERAAKVCACRGRARMIRALKARSSSKEGG